MTTFNKLTDFYRHIDNGGISVSIGEKVYPANGKDEEIRYIAIKLNANYFGYPSVSSELSGFDITVQDLYDISEAFRKAADIINNR